jgi:hypothetical protein
MSAVFRLIDTIIGRKCEVEECVCVAEENDPHCYDHSVMRLVEEAFGDFEYSCDFRGVNCTETATHMNENDVHMCENCYNIWVRIQRGNAYYGSGQRPPMRRDEEREVCSGYNGPCAVTTVAHPSDGGQVPMCSHCADRAFFVHQPPAHFANLESLFPGY